jgi:hypothetical protein
LQVRARDETRVSPGRFHFGRRAALKIAAGLEGAESFGEVALRKR